MEALSKIDSLSAVRSALRVPPLMLGIITVATTFGFSVGYRLASGENTLPDAVDVADIDTEHLASTGKAAYFNLEPGYRLRYQDGETTRTVTVRRKTKIIDGVETRVVEQREERGGQLIKVLSKYYALDEATDAVYCFGVHVDTYADGKLVNHGGWQSGNGGATFNLAVPGTPQMGDKSVRRNAQKLYEVVDIGEQVVTPAGTFTNCLRTQETNAAENQVDEKIYAPGVGPVKDGSFTLVKIVMTVPKKQLEMAAE
jgi:hypothetical protein